MESQVPSRLLIIGYDGSAEHPFSRLIILYKFTLGHILGGQSFSLDFRCMELSNNNKINKKINNRVGLWQGCQHIYIY